MRWIIGNLLTRVEDATELEVEWLDDFCSFSSKEFIPGKRRFEVRTVRLYSRPTDSFPTGFAMSAWRRLKKAGTVVSITDERVCPAKPDPAADLEWLKHHPATPLPITHQIDAVRAVQTHRRGIVWSPTGSGKTEIACGIAKSIPCRWLFFVHRGDLLANTMDRYRERLGEEPGIVGDGQWDIKRFTVVTFQTAWARLKKGDPEMTKLLREAEGIIIDECHTLPATTFLKVAQATPNAYYRVGLSGTPIQRGDKRSVYVLAALGTVIFRVRTTELIELGIISRPRIRMVQVRQLVDLPTWQGVYGAAVVKSSLRNKVLLQMINRAAKPCLVFVQQLLHGKRLEASLRKKGVAVEFVWANKSLAGRQEAIKRLVRGDTEVLICNVIFQEGVDIPSLLSVVIAAGGASCIAALQRIGRGMRASAGKSEFEVWDILDADCGCNGKEHSGCRWLQRHSRERVRAYEAEGHQVDVELSEQQDFGLGLAVV